jgi:hypothetical protein
MSGMNPLEYLIHELTSRYNFTRDHAQDAAERLMWDINIYNGFLSYLNKGQLTGYSVRGYTVESLISDYKLDPLGAFLMLAELSEYPERGEKYLKMILEEGHETVVVDEDGNKEIEFSFVEPPTWSDDGAHRCEKCGGELKWIEQYKRWYCYDCKQYS